MAHSLSREQGFTAPDAPDEDVYRGCIRVGACLSVCPTYLEIGKETDSPRGRIALIRAVGEGHLDVTDPTFTEQMYVCVGCRACEAVCPAKVRYGSLLEAARGQVERAVKRPLWVRAARWFVFEILFVDMRVLRFVARLLRLYQRSGLRALARRIGILRLLRLSQVESLQPPISRHFFVPRGQVWPAAPGKAGRRVGLLAGCVMHTAFAEVNEATVRVLQANGCDVVAADGQGCCGALHVHGGELEKGRALMRRNIAAFERAGVNTVVTNAAGCGAVLKEYGEHLRHDPDWAERAAAFSARVRDITEFLDEVGLNPRMGHLDTRVTYQEPCHLAHAQRITRAPRRVLQAIPGLRLVEMRESAVCCGSAGFYNISQPALSQRLLDRKIRHAAATSADTIATANPGCQLQLLAGVRQHDLPFRVRHIVELLDEAYRAATEDAQPRA